MNESDPKTTVRVELAKRGMSLSDLADQIDVPRQSLSRTLQSNPVDGRSIWIKILDALNLEVVIRPKQD